MADYIRGALVEIVGLPGVATPVPEALNAQPLDLNGQRAQLLKFDRDVQKWVALTFNGDLVSLDSRYIRPLSAKELGGYDIIFGPMSDFDNAGSALANALAARGYAVVKLLVSEEDAGEMVAGANRLEADGQFSRLPVEFERGYLGQDSAAKTLLLDAASPNAPDYIKDSPFRIMDDNFGHICQLLRPYSQDFLGFGIHSRTTLLLRMPLEEADEERYPTGEIDDGDAEGYLHMMSRKRLTMLQFVGPSSGSLTLSPLGVPPGREARPVRLEAEPHTVVFIAASRFDYTYAPSGNSLALTSFILEGPPVFELKSQSLVNMQAAGGFITNGPQPPPGEVCTVDSVNCRYGGDSNDWMTFWLCIGKVALDCVMEVPLNRWDHKAYYDPDLKDGGSYSKHGCFGVEGVDLFDCKFFDIPAAEARGMDPCQRQVLEVSYLALLDGGWDKRSLQRQSQNIGHFVGLDRDDWQCMSASGLIDVSGAHSAAAASNAIVSNRFSYAMNLKGASMTIDTACSSSLVCTHVSKLHLRFREFEKMEASIVNGLNLMLYPGPFVECSQSGMLSHEGRCFTFNASADGYVRGEGVGAACFRVDKYDSESQTLAILGGSQANQDGRSASLHAPNGPAQERCINAVLRECGLTPTEVDCFECNGIGNTLGDPIEIGAFRKVMGVTPRKAPLAISSSKTNLGHCEGGSGFLGLVKTILQVWHCQIAPSIHLDFINPHLDLDGFPCQIASEAATMKEDSGYSGVSSFGFGGTNAHAEAWGRNMTSRSASSHDPETAFNRQLAAAPPSEITMIGDDVREWETTGLDPRAELGSRWQVYIDADGVAEWELDEEIPHYGDSFFIRGTHSHWAPQPLERHFYIPGLWTGHITVGSNGEEHFQVLADEDDGMIFHPGMPRCTLRGAVVNGPERVSRDMGWLIEGEPGQDYIVEFFQRNRIVSLVWMKP